jgi:hypothetical protein
VGRSRPEIFKQDDPQSVHALFFTAELLILMSPPILPS